MGKAAKSIFFGVVIGAIAVATGGAGAGLFGTLAGGIGSTLGVSTIIGGAIAGGLYAGALYGISSLLKPKLPNMSDEFGREIQLSGDPVAPRKICYGEAWTAGTLRYRNTTGTDNTDLYLVIVLAGHEIDSVTAVEADGETLTLDSGGTVTSPAKWAGLIDVRYQLGSDDQTVDTVLDNTFGNWTSDHRLRGCAYAIVKLTFDEENLNSLLSFRFQVRGRMVYDPRLDSTNGGTGTHRLATPSTWEWSDNAILCANDFVRGVRINDRRIAGLGVATTRIDWANVIAEANICDEAVSLAAGGTQARYTVNGFIDPRQDHGPNLRHFEVAMAGDITFADGKWRFFAGAYRAPTLHLEPEHFIGPLRHLVHKGESARVDTAEGSYASTDSSGAVRNYPPVRLSSAVTGEERIHHVDFALVNSAPQAMRCAKLLLEREAAGKTITCTTSLYGLRAVPGETIEITHAAFGLVAQDMRVIDVQLSMQQADGKTGLVVDLTLEAGPESLYAWDAEETEIGEAPTLEQATVPFLTMGFEDLVSDLINPGLETGTMDGWTGLAGGWAVSNTDPRFGTYHLVSTGDGGRITNNAKLQVDPGDRVIAGGFGRVVSGSATVSIRIEFLAADGLTLTSASDGVQSSSSEYINLTRRGLAPDGAVAVQFEFHTSFATDAVCHFDGAFMALLPAPIDTTGQLIEDVSAGDGSTTRSVARGPEPGSARDGDVITFDPAWNKIPTVRFMSGGRTFSSTLSSSQVQDFRALNISGSGFIADLKIKELTDPTTVHTDNTVSTPSSPSGLDHSINKTQSDQPHDDRYTFQYDVIVNNPSSAEPGHATVGLYTNSGSGWVLRSTAQFFGNLGESTTSRPNQIKALVVDGLGLNDDFGINIESGSGSLNFDSVRYETVSSPATESATPDGAPDVEYMVIGS